MPSKFDSIFQKTLKKITPDYWERRETNLVIQRVEEATRKTLRKKGLSYVLAGSFVRDTWLPDKKEFDLFIMFPEKTTRENLEKSGISIGKKIVKQVKGSYEIAYAEHPYVRAKIKKFSVDIVPCYKVKSGDKIKSAVDRTPFHNKWLSEHLSLSQVPDVRLLKKFCKSLGIYGSDTKTLGLSGYLIELLIVHYKSFKSFLRKASGWEAGQVFLDISRHYNNLPRELVEIRKKFRFQPLVVIDPVDHNRNVAASLSTENFMKLSYFARDFLKKPSLNFFFKAPPKVNVQRLKKQIEKRKTLMLCLSFSQPDIIDDILWPQLRKTTKRLETILDDYEFMVMNNDIFSDGKQSLILLEMETWNLPLIRKIRGPPVFAIKNSREFINKYKKNRMWVENEFWVAEVERKFPDAEALLKQTLKNSPKKLKSMGIDSYIASSVSKRFKILKNNDIIKFAKKNKEFAVFLHNYLEKDIVH